MSKVELKEFQKAALDALEYWLGQLNLYKQKSPEWSIITQQAWVDVYKRDGSINRNHETRENTAKIPFPHACIKIPTGGGKTFVAANALMTIMRMWKVKKTGLVIWLVPTNAIYEQTLISLSKKGEWIHDHLWQMSGHRLKIIPKGRNFSELDIKNHLCIMLLTNQSFIEKENEGKEDKRLKVNRATSGYADFFPDGGNILENKKKLEEHPYLEATSDGNRVAPSVINAIRLCKPVVIIDEAHRTKREISIQGVNGLNPSIVLEISATPLGESNILYKATGTQVWEEEMIKLPVKLHIDELRDWKKTLEDAKRKRDKLDNIAKKEKSSGGNYIRPIMVIRVDYTGENQLDKSVHAEEVKKYMQKTLKIRDDQIAIQSATRKQLSGVNLMSDTCPIRYIITKDALKEGWDCPFASVLAVLGNVRAEVGVTQLVGRVMRQPYAKRAEAKELNISYVYCSTEDTREAVRGVKKGLEKEGYDKETLDLLNTSGALTERPKKAPRKKEFRQHKIYFPKIKFFDGKEFRDFSYSQDLMPRIDWDSIKYKHSFPMVGVAEETIETIFTGGRIEHETRKINIERDFDILYLAERLLDIVPNIFVAARIVKDALDSHTKEHGEEVVYSWRIQLVEDIRRKIDADLKRQAKEKFDKMIDEGKIDVTLAKEIDPSADWKMPEFSFYKDDNADIFRQEKYLFEEINTSSMNQTELAAADSFEKAKEAVIWWFRTIAKSSSHGYYLQGWQKNKVYPDFLLASSINKKGEQRYMVIETKGDHLRGNDDTEYKRELMDLIERRMNFQKEKTHYFRVIDEGDWKSEFNSLINEVREE